MEIEDIVLVIPTRGEREEGVDRCIVSVLESVGEDISVSILENTTGWLKAVNGLVSIMSDVDNIAKSGHHFLMGADDMTFYPGAISSAVEAMDKCFPDTDGVVGFNQVNLDSGSCKAGFTLIGRKFLERFKGYDFFCPDYKHYYADTEFLAYAISIGKFHYCKDAQVDHFHHSVTGYKDSTALISGQSLEDDRETARLRKELGFLWGRDFKRVQHGS